MAVVVTDNLGPGGRVRRYILGGPDDPEVERRRWPPPLLLADGTPITICSTQWPRSTP
jgi:hypothetical protein